MLQWNSQISKFKKLHWHHLLKIFLIYFSQGNVICLMKKLFLNPQIVNPFLSESTKSKHVDLFIFLVNLIWNSWNLIQFSSEKWCDTTINCLIICRNCKISSKEIQNRIEMILFNSMITLREFLKFLNFHQTRRTKAWTSWWCSWHR